MSRKKIERLFESEENKRKNISVNMDEELVKKTDFVAKVLSDLNKSRNFSRNSIIEMALEEYVTECADVMWDKYKIDLERSIIEEDIIQSAKKGDYEVEEGAISSEYNLVTFPAHSINFEVIFLGQRKWYEVRIADERISSNKLKYVALYVGSPISGLTHYGKIDKIIDSGNNNNKKIILLDGDPIAIGHTVALGDTNATSMRPPRYTTLEKLLAAKYVKDLF